MTPDERVRHINERLSQHFSHPNMFHDVRVLSDAEWDASAPADPTNLHRPFGWVPPFEREIGSGEFWFCPERIARQTTGLTDEELDAYIDVIVFTGDAHVINYHVEDAEKRVQIAEKQLLETSPGSFRLLSRVQMSIVDERES